MQYGTLCLCGYLLIRCCFIANLQLDTMKPNKVIVLAALAATLLYIMRGAEASRVCGNESRVKLSMLHGLHEHHKKKEVRILEFEREVDEATNEAKRKLVEAESAVVKMQGQLNETRDEAEEIMARMDNITSPELEELEEQQICSDELFVTDCCQIKRLFPSAPSGVYAIKDHCSSVDKIFGDARLTVYCDMETDGGGWIVIQRRNASMGWVNFTRNISDYETGFGDLDGEFWIGLRVIHELTNQQNMALKMKMWDERYSMNWNYQLFRINNKNNRYALYQLSGGSGDGPYNAFGQTINGNTDFQTYDYYRPGWGHCGYTRQSGWWYYTNQCGSNSNPNGHHQPSGICGIDQTGERLVWRMSRGYRIYTHSEMKIRPQSCNLS